MRVVSVVSLLWLHEQREGASESPETGRWREPPVRPMTRRPYRMTAKEGQWRPPHGDNENLTHLVYLLPVSRDV